LIKTRKDKEKTQGLTLGLGNYGKSVFYTPDNGYIGYISSRAHRARRTPPTYIAVSEHRIV